MNDFLSSWLGQETGHHALEIGHNMVSIRWGLTLLHFLWQGAIIGLLALVAARLLRNHSAALRYWLNAAALLVCPICVAWTFANVEVPETWQASSDQRRRESRDSIAVPIETSNADSLVDVPYPKLDPPETIRSADAAPVSLNDSAENRATATVAIEFKSSTTSEWMPIVARWIAILYAVGVICFLVRLAIALWGGHRLRAISTPVSDSALLELIRTQAHRIGLKLVPVVAYCERVAMPTVIGVLRPMILLPATLTTGLTTDELSAILSHELAHIRRYDLWMNLLQRIIESLLFFHPVVWFLSRRLSTEREICCDDLVIRSGHQPMNYAGALLRMAELCVLARHPQLASLSATGPSSADLEHRIVRLMQEQRKSTLRLNRIGIAVLLSILITCSVAPAMFRAKAEQANKPNDETSKNDLSKNVALEPAKQPQQQKVIDKINGMVLDKLQGVAVTAIFQLENDSTQIPHLRTLEAVGEVKATTDAEGQYTIEVPSEYVGNRALRVSFRFELAGYLTRTIAHCYVEDFHYKEINVDEPSWRSRLEARSAVTQTLLRKGDKLLGQVLMPDGRPASGAEVVTSTKYRAYSWKFSDPNEYGSSSSTKTDSEGRFELLADNPGTLKVSLPGYAPLFIDDLSKMGEKRTENDSPVTFRLPTAIQPRGKVTAFDGQPIAGAVIVARRDFVPNEFDMALIFEFRSASNERGEFRMPPIPAGKYMFSVQGRIEELDRIEEFNQRASTGTAPGFKLAETEQLPWPKVLPVSDVIPEQKLTLEEWNWEPTINLQAVETVSATVLVSFPDGRRNDGSASDVGVYGIFKGERWSGNSERAGDDGIVRLIVPKGATGVRIDTGHALQRRSASDQWQPGNAIHLGTMVSDVSGLEVAIPKLAKLRVKLIGVPATPNGSINIHAYYSRDGYGRGQAELQRLYLDGQVQSNGDYYRAFALPNEEIILRVTSGRGDDSETLYEERLILQPGTDQLLTIDLEQKSFVRVDAAPVEPDRPDSSLIPTVRDSETNASSDEKVPDDKSSDVEIKHPHCVLETEDLPVRSLVDAIATFNLTSRESPTGVLEQPVTEQETRDAVAKFATQSHVPDAVRAQLNEILKSGELPSNVYFRRLTRFDDGKQMQDIWWVRLVVETENGPVYSVPVRSKSLSARPYTQMERQQNAADGMTLLNRVCSYVDQAKFRNIPGDSFVSMNIPEVRNSEIERFLEQAEAALRSSDLNALLAFHDWRDTSDSTREFVAAELNRLLSGKVHYVWYSPRKDHELTTWSAWQFYKPNLPVAGYLKISYSPEVGKEKPSPDNHQVLALELGVDEGKLQIVNYIKDGEANPPEELNPGPSITGHLEPLADGTHLITNIITNPGTLLSAHLANEEIRLRDFRNASEQEEDSAAVERSNASIETQHEKTTPPNAPDPKTKTSAEQKPPAAETAANRYRILSADGEPVANAVVRLIYQKEDFRELIAHSLKHQTTTDADGYFQYPKELKVPFQVANEQDSGGHSATWITIPANEKEPEQTWLLGSSAGVRFPYFEAIAAMRRDPKKASSFSETPAGDNTKSSELPHEFRLPKFETTIRVVNADGSPAAGVQVTPSQIAWARVEGGSKNIFVPDIVRDSLSRTTDADGRVTFATIDRMEFAEIEFRSEQHGLQRTFTNMNTIGPELEHDVVLFPAGKVTGTIKANTAEQKEFLQTNKLLLQTRVINFGLPAPKGFRIAMEGIAGVTPDEQGRFELPAMLAGQMFLLDRLPDNSLHRIMFKPRQITKSSESSLIEGQVVSAVKIQGIARKRDSKEGVAGIPISIRHGGRQTGLSRELTVYPRTDADGRFEAHVFPGRAGYSSLIIPEGYVQAWNWDLDYDLTQEWLYGQRVLVPDNTSNFELPPLEFIRAKEIRGKLVDADGNPVAKTGVYARARANQNGNDFATTDQNGEFVLKGFAEGYFPESVQAGEQFKLRSVQIISRDPLILQDSQQEPK